MRDTKAPLTSIRPSPKKMKRNDWELFAIASMGAIFLLVFSYFPMAGLVLAFKDGDMHLNAFQVFLKGKWVGWANFINVFEDYSFKSVFNNTLCLNLLMLCINFPAPILFALFLNEIKRPHFKAAIQDIAIFPTFISWMTFGGIFLSLADMNMGIVNPILEFLHLSSPENPINLGEPQYFWATVIITSLIKGVGWGSIIYTAAIVGINPDIYEAAALDGASRWRVMFHITLPMIAPTVLVFFLLSIGGLLGNNFEQFYVFQNSINLSTGEVLATYSYKYGIVYSRYSFATALGLFQSLISLALLIGSNAISKRVLGRGLY